MVLVHVIIPKKISPKDYRRRYYEYFDDHVRNMTHLGYEHTEHYRKADFVITGNRKYRELKKRKKIRSSQKYIIIEAQDSSPCCLREIQDDHVAAVFKHTVLTPTELNNDLKLKGRLHCTALNAIYRVFGPGDPEFVEYNKFVIPPRDLLKIRCVIPHWSRYVKKGLHAHPRIPLAEREVDVSFLGTCNYRKLYSRQNISTLLTLNRMDLVKAITLLPFRTFTATSRLPYKDYMRVITNTKIFVSPYGWGEFSHKDFEVTLLGCVLIKPMCANFKSYPNIYQDGITCVSCKLDYSDLEEKVRYLLDNPDVIAKIQTNVDELFKTFNVAATQQRELAAVLDTL